MHRPVKHALAALLLFAVLMLAGCTGNGKGSGTGSVTRYPAKPTGTAQVTNTAKPTEAVKATEAPTPTAAPTEAPTPSPTPVPEVPPIAFYINEVLPTNNSVSKHNGGYFDMIELYNATEETIMLSDYYLSDSKKHLTDYPLPEAELEPGGYAVFYCTGEYHKEGEYDLAFKLSYFGEKVYLSDADGNIIDTLQYTRLPADASYGRDGLGGYRIYTKTSLGAENNGGFGKMAEIPAVDVEPGFYDGAIGVSFTTAGKIHYTLDGSTPDKYSRIWDGNPIIIEKTCAIRAYAEAESSLDSFVATYNYFISEPDYELDVLMLSIDEGDLSTMNANYRSSKKYKANISLFSKGKAEFTIDCGVCVTGCTSRAYEKKSYRVKFSADYGPTKLKYRVFEGLDIDDFDALVLRSGSQDNDGPLMRDEYISSLAVSSGYVDNVLVQAYRPVDLYINGEYRGIYYIRERIDEDMIAAHYGCEPEEVTLIEQMSEIKCGRDYKEWLDLWKYLKDHKLTDEAAYAYVESMVDLNSVADYFIVELWCGNVDPDNVRVAKAGDGKWFYVLYDLDLSLCREVKGTTDRYMGKYNSGLYTFNALVYRLLETDRFREIFCERFAVLAKTVFSDETAIAYIDDLAGRLDHDMVYNCDKWHGFDDPSHDIKYRSYKSWTESVASLRKAVTGRAKLIVEDFCTEKKISEELRNKYFADILGNN